MIAAGSNANGNLKIPNKAKLTNVVVGLRIFFSLDRTNVAKLTTAIREGVNNHVIILTALRFADFRRATNCV